MPGSDYSSAWLAPAPLWADIQAKRSPGTHGGTPWGLEGGKVAPWCLKQPVYVAGCLPASQGAGFLRAAISLTRGAQPSLPPQMPCMSAAGHPCTSENFQVASSLVKKIIKSSLCVL